MLAGVRHGVTLGGPIAVEIGNTEWPKWETVMAADPVDPAELRRPGARRATCHDRPGHADYAGMLKYGFDDARPVLERASARGPRPAWPRPHRKANSWARRWAPRWCRHIVSIGGSQPYDGPPPLADDLAAIDDSPVRAFDEGGRGR